MGAVRSNYDSEKLNFSVDNELICLYKETDKNIADFRHIGAGKTTDADILSLWLVSQGHTVLRIMPCYSLCQERAEKLPNAIVFKGRTQPGMCPLLEGNTTIYSYVIPKRFCRLCQSSLKINCEYLKQFKHLKKSKIIFTVKENLKLLLEKTKPTVVIIDDVNIVDIIYHFEDFKLEAIVLAKQQFDPELHDVFDALLTMKFDLLRKLLKEKREIIEKELMRLEIELFEDYEFYKKLDINMSLRVLSVLYNLIDKNPQFLPIRSVIRICWEDWSLLGKRVIYQTATPTIKEKEVFGQLGEYVTIHKEAEANPNWRVLQLKWAKYPLVSCSKSRHFKETAYEIIDLILKYLRFIGNGDMVLFLATKLQNSVFGQLKEEEMVKLLKHYGKGTLGSNASINTPIGFVGGILYKNQDFYLKPPYINPNNQKLYENPNYEYPVERSISDDEVVNHIKQEIGRVFRGDRNKKKLCIVMSNIKLDKDGIVPEIGAIVEKEDKEGIKKKVKEFFRELVYEKMAETINRELENKPKLKLDDIAKEFAKTGIYSVDWFKKTIKSPKFLEQHNLKIIRQKEGKRKDVLFILRG